jgi:hypothetical protein
MSCHLQRGQRDARSAEIGRTAAAIDNRPGGEYRRLRRCRFDHVLVLPRW